MQATAGMLVLRFTIEKAAAAQAIRADVVFTSYELVDQLRGTLQAPVLPIRNYLDQAEVQAQLATLLGGAS